MKIDAKVLQEALTFLGLVVSKSEYSKPIHRFIELRVKDGFLVGTVNDINASMSYKICNTTESLHTLVQFDLFDNIIKSCTGEIELISNDKALSIKSATMKCKLQSMHKTSKATMTYFTYDGNYENSADFSELSNYTSAIKAILNKDFSIECYRNIFFNDTIMVTDTVNALSISKKFFNTSILIPYRTFELLSKLSVAKYAIEDRLNASRTKTNRYLYILTDSFEYCTIVDSNNDAYNYQALMTLFNSATIDTIDINKELFNKGYNAAKLFKSNIVQLVFDEDGVSLKIPQSEFTYKLSNQAINHEKIFELTDQVIKKLFAMSNIQLQFTDRQNTVKCCPSADVQALYSIKEVISNDKTT